MKRVNLFTPTVILFAVAALLLSACGSGGGGSAAPATTTLSGTVATGNPLVGKVTIKDSNAQTKTVNIDTSGMYSVDVSGLTAPYMLRADGSVGNKTYHLYSAGTAADVGHTVNITTLTNLIVANTAGMVPSQYFAGSDFSKLTATELKTHANALRTSMQPILQAEGVSDSIDLMHDAFKADHTGLDAAMDSIMVSMDPDAQSASITSSVANSTDLINSDFTRGTYNGDFTATGAMMKK
ncbi:MAG: hypothetical protein GXP59_10535 [Deltaproteobacteria bacterium]|nr:hypothetical protein [Deltaproteobacteria bacterium]